MKGAVEYEISLSDQEKPLITKMIKSTKWSGELDSGVYAYRIRAYDRVHRPGEWSAARALVVMPNSPEPISPEDGKKIFSYVPKGRAELKWRAVPGVESYHVQISSNGVPFYSEIIHGTQTFVNNLPLGKYTWEVAVHYEAGRRNPASSGRRGWEGKTSDPFEFSVERQDLRSPDLISPQGVLPPSGNGLVGFRWNQVEGADAYEIKISPKKTGIDQKVKETKWVVRSTATWAKVPSEGSYTWSVRALASINESNVAEAVGAESSTEFTLDRNVGFKKSSGSFSLSSFLAPYHYSATSPGQNSYTQGQLNSTAVGLRADGDYWIGSLTGISVMAQDSFFMINNRNLDQKDLGLAMKYRTHLSFGKYPWTLMPSIGALWRDYNLLAFQNSSGAPANGTMTQDKFSTLGPAAGIEVRKQIWERFSLGAALKYYFPVVSTDGSIQRGSDSNRNMSIGIQGLYSITKVWGIEAGVYQEDRSVSNLSPSRGQPDTISNDGSCFYAGLIYNFGN